MSSLALLTKAWRHQEYAEAAGIHRPQELQRLLGLRRGDTVYDFGCGDGHMVDWLNDRGVDTIGIDMLKVHSDTVLCNLTQMSDCLNHEPRDYGLCLGLMDHIPEEYVLSTLTCLNHLARGQIYFTIPIRDLGYNDLMGKKVQQTLKPIGWWRNKLTTIGVVKIGQTDEWMTAHVQCHS
jgi:2-polyprenyl-3-methyl-5-hydroxy-6-metoxy-1,4-benzoquinol methylase